MKALSELGISPAPWSVDEDSADIVCNLYNGLKYQVARPFIHIGGFNESDINLIAAAPELYEALYDIVQFEQWVGEDAHEAHDRARAALAKASGEEVAK